MQHPSRMVTRRRQTSRLRRWEKNHTSEIHIGDLTLDFSIQLMLEHFPNFLEDYKGRFTKYMESVLQKACKLRGIQNELTEKFDPTDPKVVEC